MYFNIFKNRQSRSFKHHATYNTEYQKRDKCFVLYLNKSAIYCLCLSNVTRQISCPTNWNINIPLFVNRFDAYGWITMQNIFCYSQMSTNSLKLCFKLGFLAINHIKAQILNGLNCYNNVWIPRGGYRIDYTGYIMNYENPF